MAMTQNPIVIGVFQSTEQAKRAIDELRRAGFRDDEIGFLARAGVADTASDATAGAVPGVIGGGVVGGVLGAAAALLVPGIGPALAGGILAATLGGAAVGGLIGMLVNMGLSQDEARFYQRELEAGHTIVTVKAAAGHDDAIAILQRNGAYNAKSQVSIFNAPPTLRPRANEEQIPPPERGDESI